MRQFIVIALAVAGIMLGVSSVQAQFYSSPFQPYYPPIYRPNPGIQYLGNLPNGIPVINPWNMYNNQNYSGMAIPAGLSPYYNPFLYGYYNNLGLNPLSPYGTPSGIPIAPGVARQPGRFVPVAPDLAINPITGTRIAPLRGIALTNDGAFYRIPGTASITAWGALVPGSGEYYNPITGELYNPGTGIIVQR